MFTFCGQEGLGGVTEALVTRGARVQTAVLLLHALDGQPLVPVAQNDPWKQSAAARQPGLRGRRRLNADGSG